MSETRGVRVIVLGSAQDGGRPQMGCDCAHCERARQDRSEAEDPSSLALVDDGDKRFWLLDLTPALFRQYDWLRTFLGPDYRFSGAVITHAHIGHYLGIVELGREVMNWHHLPIYGSPRLQRFLSDNAPFSQLVRGENVRPMAVAPGIPFALAPRLHLQLIPVPHRDEFSDTMAVRVEGPRRTLLYLPDIDRWDAWDRSLPEVLAGVDLAYLDATFFDDRELPGRDRREIPHPTVAETLETLGPENPHLHKVRFIHLNHSNRLWDEAERTKLERRGPRVARRGQIEAL